MRKPFQVLSLTISTLAVIASNFWAHPAHASGLARLRQGRSATFEVTIGPGRYFFFTEGQGDTAFSIRRPEGGLVSNSQDFNDGEGGDWAKFNVNRGTHTVHVEVNMNGCDVSGGCALQVVTFNHDATRDDEDGWAYFRSGIERVYPNSSGFMF